jgi:hypothetical protein
MADVMVMQGRKVGEADIGLIRDWLAAHPEWNRTRLSQELCACWNWRNAQGRAKDMAARTLLLKLERAGYIRLYNVCFSAGPSCRRLIPHDPRLGCRYLAPAYYSQVAARFGAAT